MVFRFVVLQMRMRSPLLAYWEFREGPRNLVDRRVDSKSIMFLTSVVRAKFCLQMVRWFFPGFSSFRPHLMNGRLDINEIFLKGPLNPNKNKREKKKTKKKKKQTCVFYLKLPQGP